MGNSLHLYILLGFICQSLSWEGPGLLIASVILWMICAGLLRGRVCIPSWLDPAVLLLGCVGGFWLCKLAGQSPHFFLGHGMIALQAVRLVRPLVRREKIYSVLMATFHVGVACTILFDYRFIAVLAAALVLIPRTLRDLELENRPDSALPKPEHPLPVLQQRRQPSRILLPYRQREGRARWRLWAERGAGFLVIGSLTILFFLLFPRGLLPGLTPRASALQSQGNPDSSLDPASGGGPLSARILLQIEGEKIGYLRTQVLPYFDGQWRAGSQRLVGEVRAQPRANGEKRLLHRKVRVKQLKYLGSALPADGDVDAINGRFFRGASRNEHDLMRSALRLNLSDTSYQFWTDPAGIGTNYLAWHRGALTSAPTPSARLLNWVAQITAGSTNALQKARQLELHLQNEFTYRLGAPELNRLNSLEDFLFVQREGHCERFASALALLLRQQGIPTRVGLGYVPGSPNKITGWQTVRFRDAHAWTEAWFPERGWVMLDATPRSRLPPPSWEFNEVLDAMDLAWSSFVLNFDQSTQNYLLGSAVKSIGQVFSLAHRHSEILLLCLAGILLLALLKKGQRLWLRRGKKRQDAPEVMVSHFYGEMLHLLARAGHRRQLHQTPLEFLGDLEKAAVPHLEEIRWITARFCDVYYGKQSTLPGGLAQEIESKLLLMKSRSSGREGVRSPLFATKERGEG